MNLTRISKTSILILVLSFISVLIVAGVGRHFRGLSCGNAQTASAFLARNATEVYLLWKKTGCTGNIVVHFGNNLHFQSVDLNLSAARAIPSFGSVAKQRQTYENALSYRNFLWMSMQTGIARYIYNVLPPWTYTEKKREVAKGPYRIWYEGSAIVDADKGLLRKISDEMPQVEEPVLMNIDASYVTEADIAAFADALKRSGLRVRRLTLSLAEDNPEVPESSRTKLKELGQALVANRFVTSMTSTEGK